jgi:hypothetical protein
MDDYGWLCAEGKQQTNYSQVAKCCQRFFSFDDYKKIIDYSCKNILMAQQTK